MIKDIFLLLLSAISLGLSFYPFRFSDIFVWLGFIPLFFAIKNKSKKRAFFFSYITGVVFWSITIYWLIHVTLVGMVALILYLALYFGIFGFIFSLTSSFHMGYSILFIPTVWVLTEYLRSYLFTGFGWALLGYSQYKNIVLIQLADIGGVWLISFTVMLVNINLYYLIQKRTSLIRKIKYGLFTFLFIIFALLYGNYCLFSIGTKWKRNGFPLKVSLIQGNIPQELKWQEYTGDFIIERYFKLTLQSLKEDPDLIIWPEASLPGIKGKDPLYYMRLLEFIREIRKPVLFGIVSYQEGRYYNTAELIIDEKNPPQFYQKLHLVPFGEYIPLKKIFSFLEAMVPIGDFSKGKDYTVFTIITSYHYHLSPTKFSVLICFEDLFPHLSRGFVRQGAEFLVNITNDAWFGRSPAALQHLMASVFRAVENRVYLLRCANTGISAFISPFGELFTLKDKTGNDIFIEGALTREIKIKKDTHFSFYNRYPILFPFLLGIIFLYSIIKNAKL
ncbi:MAG: apolipoprotein N-acyltransferase [Candidatus Omnitrophica bacterium]|nr:apolipoprotein N-acyltransferase [Candidatus Omnitrophota bacterium]